MSMTREDVLRELELLPVWQVRTSAVTAAAAPVAIAHKMPEVQQVQGIVPPPVTVAETNFYVVVSDDESRAFVLPEALIGAELVLFNNILLALQLNKTHTKTLANLANMKVIVAMGELIAQQLLNSIDLIDALRGKVHTYQGIPLVVTYHPSDMLRNLPNKAKTWDDLCLAKSLAST
jgi:uracil-DNA glycosylase